MSPRLLGFAAYSGTGKTTLIVQLIPLLRRRGMRVGVIKHAHHSFDVDRRGKDSFELRKAGAERLLVASRRRWVQIEERCDETEPTLPQVLARLDASGLDLVIVEGFKQAAIDKIEVHRPSLGRPLLCLGDPHVIAVATDARPAAPVEIPLLDLNAPATVADFIADRA